MDSAERKKRREAKRRRLRILRLIVVVGLILLILLISGIVKSLRHHQEDDGQGLLMENAQALALQYDYDAAIEQLTQIEEEERKEELVTMLTDLEAQRDALVATPPEDVTHIFFHTLIVDPARGFSLTGQRGWDSATPGFCQWMTTVYEFQAIMQQMYDRGYVLVAMTDLYDKTTDENGVVHITGKSVKLPEGKKPFVLSLDDLSYYHSYDNRGTASKMIVGDDGKPTCEYMQEDGTVVTGAYDCVPLLDQFIGEHPDFSYKNARGIIALTGYNGILGYRTDYAYRDRENLSSDQQQWLDAHPDFDWDTECQNAKAVADCLKADGWTFASHTWGHMHIGDVSMDRVRADTEKWETYVAPLVGGTDTIIFAHGQDLASWQEEYTSAEKFIYMKEHGFDVFCNVDSAQYSVKVEDAYFHMGRRNLDGYRLWQAVYGGNNSIGDLVDPDTVFDPARPTEAYLYQL